MITVGNGRYSPQAGDIFACWGADWMSRLISLETSSIRGPRAMRFAPSHVAIACSRFYPQHLHQCWWESTTLADRACLEAGRKVAGCQVHEIENRIADYVEFGGTVSIYRLTEFDALSQAEETQLRTLLGSVVGDDVRHPVTYDTAGAICSGTRLVKRITFWRNQLDSLFCSELLAAVLQRLGRLCRENPSTFTPGRLMRRLISEGTYRHFGTITHRPAPIREFGFA